MPSSAAIYAFLGKNSFQVDAAAAEQGVREKYPLLLHPNESIQLAFKDRGALGRDKSYFTSHRILIKDGKGVGSKRKNYQSILYCHIQVRVAALSFDCMLIRFDYISTSITLLRCRRFRLKQQESSMEMWTCTSIPAVVIARLTLLLGKWM